MEKCKKFLKLSALEGEVLFECPECGNHVCGECALACGGICPHCFSRLNEIS